MNRCCSIVILLLLAGLMVRLASAQDSAVQTVPLPVIHGKINGMDVMVQGDAVAFMAAGKAGSLLAEMDEKTCGRDLHCTMQKNNTRAIVLNPEGIWLFDSPSKQLPDNVTVTEPLYPVSTETDLFAASFIKPTSTYIPLEGSPPLQTLHTGNEMVDSSPVREWLTESLTTHENVTITEPVLPVSGQGGLVQTEPQMPPSAIHISSETVQPSPTLNTGIPYIDQSPAIALVNQATMEWLADWVNISKSRTALSESTDYPDDSVSLLPPVRSSSSSGAVMLTTLTDDRFATLTTLRPTPAPQPVLNLIESYEKEIAAEVRLEFEQNLLTIQPSPTQANSGSSNTYRFSYQPRQVPVTATGESQSQVVSQTADTKSPKATTTVGPVPQNRAKKRKEPASPVSDLTDETPKKKRRLIRPPDQPRDPEIAAILNKFKEPERLQKFYEQYRKIRVDLDLFPPEVAKQIKQLRIDFKQHYDYFSEACQEWEERLEEKRSELVKAFRTLKEKGVSFNQHEAYERFREYQCVMEDHSDEEGNPVFTVTSEELEKPDKYRELILLRSEVDSQRQQKERELLGLDDFDSNKAEKEEIVKQLNKLMDLLNEEMQLRVADVMPDEKFEEFHRERRQIHSLINQHHHLRCLKCDSPLLWSEEADLRLWLIQVEDDYRKLREYVAYHLHCPKCYEPYHPRDDETHHYSEPIVSPSCDLSYQQLMKL